MSASTPMERQGQQQQLEARRGNELLWSFVGGAFAGLCMSVVIIPTDIIKIKLQVCFVCPCVCVRACVRVRVRVWLISIACANGLCVVCVCSSC